MAETAAVIGAGILGRTMAYRLAREGYRVAVFERRAESDLSSASFIAGGMLAPFCELEHAPTCVAQWGLESIAILRRWVSELHHPVWLQEKGTLVVAHPRDRLELERLARRLTQLGFGDSFARTERGLFFAGEAHVCPKSLMQALYLEALDLGVRYFFSSNVGDTPLKDFDLTVDCRGLGAKDVFTNLRGVRGEVVELECADVRLESPVRLMHPKYPVYIIPRPNRRFVIGATVIESEKTDPITAQSLAELISAALTVHPGFAEANVISTGVQCRPALPDHLPAIRTSERRIQINGLYRHGYLLTPFIVDKVIRHLKEKSTGENLCLSSL